MKLNVSDDQFEQSKNIAINILDATNLWIENCLLYQQQSDEEYDCTSFDLDHDLLITMYVYGFASRALSLLMLSCKFDDEEKHTGDNRLFYGLKLNPDTFYPAEILKYHPVVYFNTILAGNQNTLSVADDLGKADDQPFGKGFYLTYGVEFINSLRMMSTFEHTLLYDGKYAFTVIDKQDFIDVITAYSQGIVDPKLGEKAAHNGHVIYTLDFDVTPHMLRHTYITNLIYSGADPKTVQYLAGHESSKITMDIYAKVKYNRPEELAVSMAEAFALWDD